MRLRLWESSMPVFFLVVMLDFTYTVRPLFNFPFKSASQRRNRRRNSPFIAWCEIRWLLLHLLTKAGRGPGAQNPRYFNLSPPPKTSIASWAALSKHKNTLPIRTVQPPHLPTHSQCSTCIKCATALAGCQPLPKASRGEANSVTEWRRCPNPGNASLAEKDQSGRFRCLEPIKCGAGGRPRSLGSRWI